MVQGASPFHETSSIEQESQQLEVAICNAVTSLHDDNELYIQEEEKEKLLESTNKNATKYLNIQRPMRPIT